TSSLYFIGIVLLGPRFILLKWKMHLDTQLDDETQFYLFTHCQTHFTFPFSLLFDIHQHATTKTKIQSNHDHERWIHNCTLEKYDFKKALREKFPFNFIHEHLQPKNRVLEYMNRQRRFFQLISSRNPLTYSPHTILHLPSPSLTSNQIHTLSMALNLDKVKQVKNKEEEEEIHDNTLFPTLPSLSSPSSHPSLASHPIRKSLVFYPLPEFDTVEQCILGFYQVILFLK
ncbi:MAG: hypothetical protein AABY22_19150, partial [Nanoarchaeota archaeon]